MRQRGFGGGSGGGGGGGVTSLAGTTHQIIVSSATGGVTVSTPQDIDTTSNPTFTTVVLTGTASLTAGTSSSLTGQVKLKNSTNNNVLTLQPGATASNLTLNLPTADGTNGQVLTTNGSGSLGFTTASGGGSPGGAATNVQVNDGAGGFTGDASFTYSTTTHALVLATTNMSLSSEGLAVVKTTSALVIPVASFLTNAGVGWFVNPTNIASTDSNMILGNSVLNVGAGAMNITFSGTQGLLKGFSGIDLNPAVLGGSGSITVTGGDLALKTAGNTLCLNSAANGVMGSGTLSSGSATISTTAVTAASFIFLTDTSSGIVNVGTLTVSSISAGTNFIVKSTNVADSGTFNWVILKPS